MANTAYGDISPRTAAFAAADMLKRGLPHLVLERFGQAKTLPSNTSKVVSFRRYNSLSSTPTPLQEGVTPEAKKLSATDVDATLVQYGDRVTITDVVMDTHEDPVLTEAVDVLGEQAAEVIETVRFNILKAGTNTFYANGSQRSAVNSPLTLTTQRKITRSLKRQNARKITRVLRSTPDFGTQSVAPAYIALCHPDLENDIRGMNGFVPVESYGQLTPYESEIGKVEDVRYITTTVFEPFADTGGEAGAMLSTSGTKADVYPVLYLGRDAYGIVALKGQHAITPLVVNPQPSDSDPLAQRGHVGWKSMQTAVILNDAWMVRAEVAATA
ncbi:MAG: N4-gp56 family major capsid protein [Desulfovibrio sp.]|uniref:N4-gp56 family major capsid protein n=1 Tax=Desulfovibrio sp. 7SRBS1 TaxID=3378064 RepID=UPI003B3DB43C